MGRIGTSKAEGKAFRAKAWSSVMHFVCPGRVLFRRLSAPWALRATSTQWKVLLGVQRRWCCSVSIHPDCTFLVSSTWCPFSSTSVAPFSTTSLWHQQVGLWLRKVILGGGCPEELLWGGCLKHLVSMSEGEPTACGSLFFPSLWSQGTVGWLGVCCQALALVWSLTALGSSRGRRNIDFAVSRLSFDTLVSTVCCLPDLHNVSYLSLGFIWPAS